MQENTFGYVRKVNTSTGKLMGNYLYAELLLSFSLRARLRNELEQNKEIRLFCSCSPENIRPVYINDQNSIFFPTGIGHTAGCVAYITRLSEHINNPLIKELSSNRPCLPVSFTWVKGARIRYSVITDPQLAFSERISLQQMVKYINYYTFFRLSMEIFHSQRSIYPDLADFLQEISFEFGKCTLTDQSGNRFGLGAKMQFCYCQQPGTVSFVYAKVIAIDRTYKSHVYIKAEHINGTSVFEINHDKWNCVEPDIDQELPLYMCGFVRTEEGHIFVKGKRDSITHTYQEKQSGLRELHRMLSFVLFHVNSYGLLCCSKEEYQKTNRQCNQGELCNSPFFSMFF